MRLFCVLALLVAACSDVGSAVVENGRVVRAWNDKPYPVLSASKIIPAAMAIERNQYPELVERVLVVSDNKASDELVSRLGGTTEVKRWLSAKGLPNKFALECEMIANPEAYQLRPSELALVLDRVKSPKLLALMARTQNGNDRIRAVYPRAPHKSGTFPGVALSDVGYVDGRVIAVMGRGVEPADLATATEELR